MEWHNWLATPREGGGLSRGCWIAVYSRALLTLVSESRSRVKLETMRLGGASHSKILLLPVCRATGPLQCINGNMSDWNRYNWLPNLWKKGKKIWNKNENVYLQIDLILYLDLIFVYLKTTWVWSPIIRFVNYQNESQIPPAHPFILRLSLFPKLHNCHSVLNQYCMSISNTMTITERAGLTSLFLLDRSLPVCFGVITVLN